MSCDAHIRPFPNDTEIACSQPHEANEFHAGVLADYAYEGSKSVVQWQEDDRRNFHGDWPGFCVKTTGCSLPNFHRGNCAQ